MHRQLPTKKCSKCGSSESEEFYQHDKAGTRCLKCGHEKTENVHTEHGTASIWNADNADRTF